MTKGKKIALGVFIAGGAIGMLVSLGIAQMIHMTGDDKFCVSCHVMEPMRDAYLNDIHGGKNRVGVKADCVACHLPHNNVLNYVFRKAYNGATEAAAMVFSDPYKYDWETRRKNRKHFVYDSGCISCHKELKTATNSNLKSFLPHRDYFNGASKKTCAECHEHVGHKNLGLHLKKANFDTNQSN